MIDWTKQAAVLIWFVAVSWGAVQAAPHGFELDTAGWDDRPGQVHLAGSFNGWSRDATPMAADTDGVYRVTLDLPDGVHLYKFVIDGQRWINDPVHSDKELEDPDGHGGMNSAVLVGFDARRLDPPRPGELNTERITHDPETDRRVVATGRLLTLQARAQAGDAVSVVAVITEADGAEHHVEMPRVSTRLGWDTFSALIPVASEQIRYALRFSDGPASHEIGPLDVAVVTDFQTPDWAKDAVWYQVFVERFRNGDPDNDPGGADYENLLPWTSRWWATHPRYGEAPGPENFYEGAGNVWRRRYGGDLQGVRDALPYLRTLGVNAIYLNPVFEADSMHKYDASDFRHIDDNFGVLSDTPTAQVAGETDDPATWGWSESDRVFLEFVDEAHRQGFKVIIDGVFNHVGRSHPFFQDVLARGPESRYADWFEIIDWGDPANWRLMDEPQRYRVHGQPGGIQWKAWDGPSGHLPVFKKDDRLGLAPGPREHVFAITRRWLAPDGDPSRGIDGWRLDVPGDIPHPFWIDWRRVVKDAKPDAYITGEIWHFAQPWLSGDQFDAVMNYEFAKVVHDFFINQDTAIPPSALAQRLYDIAYAYPLQVALVQQNLFDSHDTDRVASMLVNPDRPYDGENRLQDSGPGYNRRQPTDAQWKRLEQAVAFQMTCLGAPLIYYGTEAGMWSPDDPSNRMPMVWRDLVPYDDPSIEFREDLFEHYQKLIAIRHGLPALRWGTLRTLLADDEAGVIVFARDLDDQHVYVAINRSPRPRRARFELTADDGGGRLVNLLGPGHVAVIAPDEDQIDGRPVARLTGNTDGLAIDEGRVTVDLPPFGTAIIVNSEALP